MTPALLIVGGLLVFWASISIMTLIPALSFHPVPSEIWRPLTGEEQEGNLLYVRNGCSYCHSQFIRVIDWGHGAQRIADAGDYYDRQPSILGTERTGPDLSEEGGEHPDDWHVTHFINPRYTSPISVMPSWEFLGTEKIQKLILYMQAEGLKGADYRVGRQKHWKAEATAAYRAGADRNVEWLHGHVPVVWRNMPNPYSASPEALERGHKMYQEFCIGCHGLIGDGEGPAAAYLDPPPLNFTTLRRNLAQGKYIGGIFYYQIMNGITGTAMPYFKRMLESEKIWDLSNYVAVNFVGYTDAGIEPKGIDASYEDRWENPYRTPQELGEKPAQKPESVGPTP
jgi:cbb3-type cytochrome c oxidase subunit II